MLIHELTATECRDVLSRATVARLACARGEQPYIVPVSFAYDRDGDALFGFSTVGKKVDWMRENPKVCVEVDDVADRFHWTTVVIVGRYEEIDDSDEARSSRRRAYELFSDRAEWWLPGAAKLSDQDRPNGVVYQIHIDSLTGRRAARPRRDD